MDLCNKLVPHFFLVCCHKFVKIAKVKVQQQSGSPLSGLIYSRNYQGTKYPAPDNWCDLLIKAGAHSDDLSIFVCPSAKPSEYTQRCHYAINPNAMPNSPQGIVLLFETKEGWNQHGGPELLNFDNHLGKGCYVLFNNGSVEFIAPDHIDELKWKDDAVNNKIRLSENQETR